jgi:hypothetical protein
MEDDVRSEQHYELGTWGFLRLGWWVLHVVAIVAVFYWAIFTVHRSSGRGLPA